MKLRALHEVADLVARARELGQIYPTAVDAVLVATEADRASILVFDEAGVMRFRAWRGLSDSYRAAVEGHSPWAPGERNPAPVLVPDVRSDPSVAALRDILVAEGFGAVAFIPLLHRDRLLGKFMLYYNAPHAFSDDELNAAGTVATQVAFALDRARTEAAMNDLMVAERAARHEAEAATQAKDEFLAMLAHELRNPLSAIVNAVGILDRAKADDDAAPILARSVIRRQTDHLARLLDDLLDVARITRGRIELRTEPIDLRTAATLAIEAQRHRIREKAQVLSVSLPAEPVIVQGDPARLQQVIGNVVDNASKYTDRGGSIEITMTRDDAAAVVRVRDNGVGIPKDRLAAIFEPFTQIATRVPSSGGGLGIGLTLVKRLIELHGGTVEAQSNGPHTGSQFAIRLPITTDTVPARSAFASKTGALRRFVVIEDNDDAREALLMALRLDGHEAHGASTGTEGIDVVVRERPEIVLVDIGLPDIDGHEVARRLREDLGPDIHLVALTGYGQPEDRKRSADAGFDDHLVKPVAGEDVLRLITP